MKLHYFPQRKQNDCLVAATECLMQMSREFFGSERMGFYDNGFFKYSSVLNVCHSMRWGLSLKIAGRDEKAVLSEMPAIIGVQYGDEKTCHALFWDGRAVFDPWHEEFYTLEKCKVAYLLELKSAPTSDEDFQFFVHWCRSCDYFQKNPDKLPKDLVNLYLEIEYKKELDFCRN